MSIYSAEVALAHGSGFKEIDGIYRMTPGTQANALRIAQLLYARTVEEAILSGRGPLEGDYYATSEAKLMADYLVEQGFDPNIIHIEDKSTSAVANWANSAPIITDEIGATSVIGVARSECRNRMGEIGRFVAEKSDFFLVGYEKSNKKPQLKGIARESANYLLVKRFLKENKDTPIDKLSDAYEKYKEETKIFGLSMSAVKRFVHRNAESPSPA